MNAIMLTPYKQPQLIKRKINEIKQGISPGTDGIYRKKIKILWTKLSLGLAAAMSEIKLPNT